MPLSPEAEQDLREVLQAFHAEHSGIVAPTGAGKALEAWILMRLAHNIQQPWHSWTVTLRRGDGSLLANGESFNFPSGSSGIPASNPNGPGYVLFEHDQVEDMRFELRGSVQWKGRSNATHEIDICLLPATIGEAIRQNGGGHPRGLPLLAVECKDKVTLGTLDETRQTLARMYDLVLVTQPLPNWTCRIYESQSYQQWGQKSSRYISAFRKGLFAIVRAGGFQSGTAALGDHYAIARYPNIYTSSTIGGLEQQFRQLLGKIGQY